MTGLPLAQSSGQAGFPGDQYPTMTKFTNILLAGAVFLFTSCNVYQDVQITKDKTVDFSQYETYAWLPDVENVSESDYNNDFIRQKTRNYFGHCMAQRQLEPDTINPQLLLRIEWLSHARALEVPQVRNWPDYYDAGYYNAPTVYIYDGKVTGRSVWGKENPEPEVIQYAHGGAKLTAIDRLTNRKVWEGVAQGDLYDPNIMSVSYTHLPSPRD